MFISQGKALFRALREHGFFVFSRRHGSGADDEPGEYHVWPNIYDTDETPYLWFHQNRPFMGSPEASRILCLAPESLSRERR